MDSHLNLNSFLRFGYFLDFRNIEFNLVFPKVVEHKWRNKSDDELVSEALKRFKASIENNFKSDKHHVVPLSGGIDSRAILAELLNLTSAKNITTFTFGTPGSLDFEIGKAIAKRAGVKHYPIDLNSHIYSMDEMLDASRRIRHQSILFQHFPFRATDEICTGNLVWSGAIIDVFFGRHYHASKGRDLAAAKLNFIKENEYVKSVQLHNVDDEQLFPLIQYKYNISNDILHEHVLDLDNRQLKYIAPHVMPLDYEYAFLFKDSALTEFSFQIAFDKIEHQALYKKMMLAGYRDFFKYKTKSNNGVPLNSSIIRQKLSSIKNSILRRMNSKFDFIVNPLVNYIDFDAALRKREDIKSIVYENLQDLKKRNIVPWINIDKLWKDHLNKRNNHSDALIVLASLEIHLKAGKRF